jgi:hypothetical protein
VINKLSLIYNVDIEILGDNLKDYCYHATFHEESLEEILRLLHFSAPISFKEVEKGIHYPMAHSRRRKLLFTVKINLCYKIYE